MLQLIIVSLISIRTYIQTRRILFIDAPEVFAKQFDRTGSDPEDIKLSCKFFAINCEGNEYYSSPLFPYVPLKTTLVEYVKCKQDNPGADRQSKADGSRYLLVDSIWKVFWVGVVECSQREKLFFGPYRFNKFFF